MVQPMIPLRFRWVRGLGWVAVLSAIYWGLDGALTNSLRNPALVSGLVLISLILLLGLFNARKKLPFLPLLKASTWLEVHIYGGLFAVVLFLFHIGLKAPQGFLEISLAILFLAVSLSGFFG